MPIDRERLTSLLAGCPAEELAAILRAAGLDASPEAGSEALARRVVRALWWRTHTPLGAWASADTLDDILDAVARRAGVTLEGDDAIQRLVSLVGHFAPQADGSPEAAAEAATTHPAARRLSPGLPWGALVGTSAAGTAVGARWASTGFLRLVSGPIGRILPLLPTVGPTFVLLRRGAQVVAQVSGPAGVALALASMNAALGADYDRALPLLLGLGLVLPRSA